MLTALRIGDFRLLLAGGLVSSAGSCLLVVALPYRVFQLTGSASATSVTLAAQALPALVLGPVAGVVVDRWDHRRLMIIADVARAIALTGLFAADRPDRVGWVYAALLAESAGTIFFRPAARALVPGVVGTGPALADANALLATTGAVVQLAGPPLGAVLLTWFGLPVLVVADLASYVVSAVALAFVRHRATREPGPARPVLADIVAGVRFVARLAVLRWLLLLTFVFFTANGVFTALLVPFLASRFSARPGGIGLLLSALGAGFLLGAPVAGRVVRDRSPRWPCALGLAGIAACFTVLANAPTLAVAVVATGLLGLPSSVVLVTVQTTLQRATPERVLGRVGATFFAADALADVLGALVGAAVRAPLPTVLTSAASVIFVCAAVAAVALV